jgi:SAM-dependent methyltransferase
VNDPDQIAEMFEGLASDLGGPFEIVLDFGCGAGRLVEALQRRGISAFGVDVIDYVATDNSVPRDHFALLSLKPYRLPYPDNHFDAVVSTSVLEHAQNVEEVFSEIHRVLKPGGWSVHVYPSRWYMPAENHTYVPYINYFWPNVPRSWLKFWAMVGVRNEAQRGKSADEVIELNLKYSRENLIYLSTAEYERLSMEIFGNASWPMRQYFRRAGGGVAKIWRALPFKRAVELFSRECRMRVLAQRKMPASAASLRADNENPQTHAPACSSLTTTPAA